MVFIATERLRMKKNILSYIVLLFGITILSTGCTITANTDISFDNKDNMKVETTVLFPKELMAYSDESTKQDLTKDIFTEVDGIDAVSEVQEIDSKDSVGNRKIEVFKNISKAKAVTSISFIMPQNAVSSILTVKNYVLFKKYVFNGKIKDSEKTTSSDSTYGDINPNSFISSKVRIQVPSHAKGTKANTNIKDADNKNIYVWKIDYTGVNPINLEFYMINWYMVIGTIVVLALLIFYLLSGKSVIDIKAIFAKTKETLKKKVPKQTQNVSAQKATIQPKQPKNPMKIVVITLVLLTILGVSVFFSLPTICNILVDNSIKNVYVGETAKATQMIEIANILNFDKNTDLSKEIFAKGLNEIENNDTKTAKALFDLVSKTKTQNNKKYATELTNKAMKALKQNQLSKCKYLTEAAVRFDVETPKTLTTELGKKQYDLAVKKKYQEALIISEILIMLEPKNAENHFRHGASLAFLGKDKEAVSAYTEAIKLKKEFGSAYLNRGLIYANKLSDDDKALADFEQAINICFAKNELAMAKLNISKIYMKRKNYERVMVNACSAEEIFFELGDHNRRMESMTLCNTAICKSGGYCGPIYYY